MTGFWIGLSIGCLLVIPIVGVAVRRAERRVRELADRARAAERLAELGTLTGGLAHEIKNPLSSVGLNIQLIQEDLKELGPRDSGVGGGLDKVSRIQRRVESLARETGRLRNILEDFLRFAGRVKLDLGDVDVNQLLGELVDFFTPQAQAAGVRIRADFAATPSGLVADAGLVKQAVLNLMVNAVQAMSEARGSGRANGGCGELIIRAKRAGDGEDERVVIYVIDTGPGIPAEHIDKVFQPYFSTKKSGTGLGLPTARRIVEEHGGSIAVHSEVGRGTEVVVSLPVRPGGGNKRSVMGGGAEK